MSSFKAAARKRPNRVGPHPPEPHGLFEAMAFLRSEQCCCQLQIPELETTTRSLGPSDDPECGAPESICHATTSHQLNWERQALKSTLAIITARNYLFDVSAKENSLT